MTEPEGPTPPPSPQHGQQPPPPGPQPQYGQPGYGQPPYGQQYGQPYGQQPYPPPYGYAAPVRPTNTMAIIALVMAFVFAPVGLVLGFIARRQIRETGEEGDGLALAGIIIGGIFTALYVLLLVGFIILVTVAAGTAVQVGNNLPTYLPPPTTTPG